MAKRLKYYIAQKVSLNTKDNILPHKYAAAMKTVASNPNDFCLEFMPEPLGFNRNTLTSLDPAIELSVQNQNSVTLRFNKNFFVKNVLEETIHNHTKIQYEEKNIVIDYSSPNIAKPFHVGHLRSTLIGNFISRINQHFNNNVTSLNYLGDWGTQFGLLKVGMSKNNMVVNDLKDDPIKKLFDCYVAANKLAKDDASVSEEARRYFSAIERGEENLDEWKQIKQFTVSELKRIYQRLNVEFDVYNWESDYNAPSIKHIVDILIDRKVACQDHEGKWISNIDGRDVAVLKSDGSSLYLTRDIAAALDRFEKYNFDRMLYVVDNAQTDHFKALFNILKMLNKPFAEKCEHIKFGRVKGMSTRRGQVVFLNDILDEAKSRVYQMQLKSPNTRASAVTEDVCDILGASAVIINDLKRNRQKDYKFEWERTLQTEGDSGIRLQYLHCRLCSLEQNCNLSLPNECDSNALVEPEALDLVFEIARFDDVLENSCVENEASILVSYLFRFAHKVNRALQKLNVKNSESCLGEQRLLLFHASRLVLRKGLLILGLKPLKEM